jgi:hypothetical protein
VIPNVTRGGRTRGLLRYLVGPGHDEAQVHTQPHLVAGDQEAVLMWGGEPELDVTAAEQIAAHLDAPRQRYGTRVTALVKGEDGAPALDEHGEAKRKDAHVWHCSLSLHPSEDALADDQWRAICEQFVAEMGFEAAGCRWVAVRHGESAGGNDHVHLVVALVGESGHAASVHLDRPRAQECARGLERQHGLRVVEGRDRARGARATNTRQTRRAESEHRAGEIPSPEPDRELLERAVRTLAAASESEAEFVRRVRAHAVDGRGLVISPRFAAGREDQVVGYSVALAPSEGREVVRHAGGTLAKDLTLPRLRGAHGWTAADPAAIDEWRRVFEGREPGVGAESNPWVALPSWEDALAELRAMRDAARDLPEASTAERAELAGGAAAVFEGWASLQGDHQAALRDAAARLALSAQIRAAEARLAAPLPRPRGAALLLLAASQPKNRTVALMALAAVMSGLVDAIARQHQAAGELQQAHALAKAVAELAPLRRELERQRAVEDPAWAGEQQALAVGRAARPPVGVRPRPSSPEATPAPNRPPGQSQSPKRKR